MQEKSPALDKVQPRGLGDKAAQPRRKSPTVRGPQPVYQNVRVERNSSHSGEKRVLERKVSHPGEKRVLERKVSNPRDIKKSSGTSGQARAKGRVRRNRSTQEKGGRRLDQEERRYLTIGCPGEVSCSFYWLCSWFSCSWLLKHARDGTTLLLPQVRSPLRERQNLLSVRRSNSDQTPSRKVVTRMGLQEQESRRQEQENLLERVARKHSLRNDSLMSPHKVGRRSNGRIGSRR